MRGCRNGGPSPIGLLSAKTPSTQGIGIKSRGWRTKTLKACLISPIFPKHHLLTPPRTLRSAQVSSSTSVHEKLLGQTMKFNKKKKPHFLCKKSFLSFHLSSIPKFYLLELSHTPSLTSQSHINH